MARKINITETIIRDAQQSLIATRMPFADFGGILDTLDEAGYASLECWGGATFDSCLRFLGEDPWERLRKIKARMRNTPLQMLLRGQNILGYKHYPDDVVRLFVSHAADNGMDIFRIFDALNDLRNIETAVDEVLKKGKHAQGCICYTESPLHNLELYVKLVKTLVNMGVQSVCIKDMSGIIGPSQAYDLISAIKASFDIPVVLHTHSNTGLGPITYLKAVEAGVDGIDTAISSFSGGTSQPPTETIDYALKSLGYETGLDEKCLKEINDFFKPLRAKYLASGLMNPLVLSTETDALAYQVPGGMLSNMIAQMEEQNALDKYTDVLLEVPNVRKDLGYPPLVTPISQMVGAQALANVLTGERYKNISKEVKSYIKGEYGKAPGEINDQLINKTMTGEEFITCRFADTLEPAFEVTKKELGHIARSDEDVLSYIAFPQIAEKFFADREARESKIVTYHIEKKAV